MGTFRYPVVLYSPDRSRSVTVETLVDTGATYTWVPAPVLQGLGHQPSFRQRLRLADGTVIERDGTEVVVEIDGARRTTVIIFGDPDSEALLGAVTLEQFSLAPDPVARRLVPVVALMAGSKAVESFGIRQNRRGGVVRVVDLRSDTVTQPTPEMRRAMSLAEVGDDVLGEDPTVHRLEERAAELLGKEAALFLPSGTMGNQVALKAWTRPGQEVILDARAHIVLYEMAAMAVISGLLPNLIPTEAGHFGAADVAARVRPPVSYVAPTGLVSVENTHNMAGGTIFPQERLAEVYDFCRSRGLPVHMDGARIFNAAVAQGLPVRAIAQYADSVMFSLSKGLACPVGSVLCGPRDFIEEARRVRKMLGGGMRQAGILAAAGLVALDTMVERLAEDHARARTLAEGLADLPGLRVDLTRVQTNIVIVETTGPLRAEALCERLRTQGVLALPVGPDRIRMVTHYHITDDDIRYVLDKFRQVVTVA